MYEWFMTQSEGVRTAIAIGAYLAVGWVAANVMVLCGWTAERDDVPPPMLALFVWPLVLFVALVFLAFVFLSATFAPAHWLRRTFARPTCGHCHNRMRHGAAYCPTCGHKA